MTRPAVPNGIKIELNWTGPGATEAHNILHAVSNEDISDPTDISTIATALGELLTGSSVTTPMTNYINQDWSLATVAVYDLSGTTGASATYPLSVSGGEGGSCMPPNVGYVVRWPIARSYRGGHPRSTFPGVSSGLLSADGSALVGATGGDGIQSLGAAIRSGINAIVPAVGKTLTHVIVSYFLDKALRGTPVTYATGEPEVDQRLGSMRRRLGKGTSFYTG